MKSDFPRIRDPFVKAPTGWWVIDDKSGAKIESNSYRNLKQTIISHRKANELEWDNIEVEDMIHRQVCQRESDSYCQKFTRTTHGTNPPPNIPVTQLLKDFAGAMARWAGKGFPMASEETVKNRFAICGSCPHWIPKKEKCGKCGCSKFKLYLSTSRCPLNPPKWT